MTNKRARRLPGIDDYQSLARRARLALVRLMVAQLTTQERELLRGDHIPAP